MFYKPGETTALASEARGVTSLSISMNPQTQCRQNIDTFFTFVIFDGGSPDRGINIHRKAFFRE
jgi:hypothetical protein